MRSHYASALRVLLIAVGAILRTESLSAQNQVRPYEVHPDKTVTFRVRAPNAADVKITGHFLPEPHPLKKDQNGVWSGTIGPLAPQIYHYAYLIDGTRFVDSMNGYAARGSGDSAASMLQVPADAPSYYDAQRVPHGTIRVIWYDSNSVGAPRSMRVYTPPGYETGKEKFPTLYLLHGANQTENDWTEIGRANFILDNLIAQGKARKMIVVMPYGMEQASILTGKRPTATYPPTGAFRKDLLEEIIPVVEKQFRVTGKAEDRAIAGLSMGGAQSIGIGLTNMDKFRYVGSFSLGPAPRSADRVKDLSDLLPNPDASNKKVKLIWIGCGTADGIALGTNRQFTEMLKKYNIRHTYVETEGRHEWKVWRFCLHEFLPLLFKNGSAPS